MTRRAGVPLSLVVLAAVAALGCGEARRADADGVDGGRDGSPDAGGGPGTDAGEGPPMDAGPDEIDDCPTSSLDAGDYRFDLEIDGGTRSFAMHVPPTVVDGTPLPLILNFHGFTANAKPHHVAVEPDGTGGERVIGFVGAGPARHEELGIPGEVPALYLLAERHGRGIGRALWDAAVEDLRSRDLLPGYVWVLADNPTIGFYRHVGGVEIARRPSRFEEAPDLEEVALRFEG